MTFTIGARSLAKLDGVHPDLVKVVQRAITLTEMDFAVIEGLRTKDKQAEYVARGKSLTMNSRHLTGHAVDLGAWVDGKISWESEHYPPIARAMKQAAHDLNIPLEWGGDWTALKDLVHFELPRAAYPV